ncbi:hypothetical protein BGZ65_005684, partial [Modicella reniformis]
MTALYECGLQRVAGTKYGDAMRARSSIKFLKETTWDLFRESRTILMQRVQDTHNRVFRGAARFLVSIPIYTGDRGFKTFEMKPAPGDSYVALYKDHPTYKLPSVLGNMRQHVQGIFHFLQSS